MPKAMETIRAYYVPLLGHGSDMRSREAWSYGDHRHVELTDLVLCLGGHIEHSINGQQLRQSPGQAVLVRDGDIHALSGSGFRFLNINFSESTLMLLAEGMGLTKTLKKPGRQDDPRAFELGELKNTIIEKALRFIERQFRQNAPVLLRSLLADVLTALALSRTEPAEGRMPWIQEVCDRIDLNLGTINASDLPALCGRSAAHISRSFRNALGETPSQYIRRLRVERAAVRLAGSNEEISKICFDLGFGSLSYFYRVFHQQKGMPPRAFRRRNNPFVGEK
jgi:AraC family cel operon transcriptional repressor